MNPTMAGLSAIAMWSLLALLTAATGDIPPLQLLAMTFFIGGAGGVASCRFRGIAMAGMRLPCKVWLMGIGGLFGYHFFYYTALRNAPVAEASLIAYLWPMLIVLGSAILPGERLRWHHVAGTLTGFFGAAMLVWNAAAGATSTGSLFGYASALACAFIWAAYSIASRSHKQTPTHAVALYCLAVAALSLLAHVALEQTVWPQTPTQWLAVAALGCFPVGLAFYAWDHGVKHGNIQLLGAAAYFAPLLSTLILVATGYAQASPEIALACLLIVLGALLASGRVLGIFNKKAAP